MTTVVLDASAAVRAVMDPARQPALLDRLVQAEDVVAPTLLRVETANALWKYQRDGRLSTSEALERHAEALALVQRFVEEDILFPEALRLAVDADHPVYDAVYAVTARRQAATLVTFDRHLSELCKHANIACEHFA
jgi:predicted nucleic acid-binding protein